MPDVRVFLNIPFWLFRLGNLRKAGRAMMAFASLPHCSVRSTLWGEMLFFRTVRFPVRRGRLA